RRVTAAVRACAAHARLRGGRARRLMCLAPLGGVREGRNRAGREEAGWRPRGHATETAAAVQVLAQHGGAAVRCDRLPRAHPLMCVTSCGSECVRACIFQCEWLHVPKYSNVCLAADYIFYHTFRHLHACNFALFRRSTAYSIQ